MHPYTMGIAIEAPPPMPNCLRLAHVSEFNKGSSDARPMLQVHYYFASFTSSTRLFVPHEDYLLYQPIPYYCPRFMCLLQ